MNALPAELLSTAQQQYIP